MAVRIGLERSSEMTTNNNNHGTVLITGASAGIGRELALEFSARAETLVVVARRLDRLEQLRADLLSQHPELKVIVLAADLSDERDVERLLGLVSEQAGPVNVLVNNAGLGDSVLFDRSDWTRTRQILRTNIFAMAQLASALVPGMVKRGRGGVLNIGSGSGLTVMPNAAAYVGSKHFVAGFSEALRADLAGTGVTVTQVCPGPVDSEFYQVAGSEKGMIGAPPKFFRISAAQCAREALAGFERGDAVVFPGRRYRFLMRALPLLPLWFERKRAANAAARLRARQLRNG
jgi:short-subunit dehydrogenase